MSVLDLPRPPEVTTNPVVGFLPEFLRDPFALWQRGYDECGPVAHSRIGFGRFALEYTIVFDPVAAEHVLTAPNFVNFVKQDPTFDEMRTLFGEGLVTAQADVWKRQRRLIQPLFTPKATAAHTAVIAAQAARTVTRLRGGPRVIDADAEMKAATLAVVCRLLFGESSDAALPVVRAEMPVLLRAVATRGLNPLAPPLGWPTPGNRRVRAARRRLSAVCDRIIADHDPSAAGDADLVGRLLGARVDGDRLSAAEVRDQVLIFLLAGHETTATALTFALHLLGTHPDVQDRVAAEALAAEDSGAELEYTTRVIKETMRLYPSAPAIARRAVDADALGGYAVPARGNVVVVVGMIHRRPDLWPDPLRFDPDRFLPAAELDRPRAAWMPFSHGPRQCIGIRLAMAEATLMLAALIREFRVTSLAPERPRLKSDTVLHAAEPIRVRLEPR